MVDRRLLSIFGSHIVARDGWGMVVEPHDAGVLTADGGEDG